MIVQQNSAELFAMTAWSIWTQRNQVQLNQAASVVHHIAQQSKDKHAEFLACQSTSTASSIERHARNRSRNFWEAHPADTVKINLDGAVFSGENKSGIGVVIRDCLGLVIASCSKIVQQAYSNSENEALVAATALSFTANIGINKAIFKGDLLVVIKELNEHDALLSSIGPWIEDAKTYANSFFQLLYSNVII